MQKNLTNLWDPRPARPHDKVPAPAVEKKYTFLTTRILSHTQTHTLICITIHPALLLANLNGGLSRQWGSPWASCCRQRAWLVPRGSDKGEVFGCRQDLSLGHRHIFFASCHHKDWLLSSYWCFNVGVGLGSEGLYLAAYREQVKERKKKDWR